MKDIIKTIKEQKERVPKGKILLPGGAGGRSKSFHKLANFEKIKKAMEATGKLDTQYFNSSQELGMFIDWYNQAIKDKRQKFADNEILEISKFLVRTMDRKSFVFKKQ